MAHVLALCADLILASRAEGALAAAGHEVVVRSGAPGSFDDAEEFDLVVADLDSVDARAVAGAARASLGFYAHVDVETRRRAQEAGFDLVVPRSRMARELPRLAASLLD